MIDSSNFVLRWKINNASGRLDAGKVESGVFDEGGFKWTATVARQFDDNSEFTLRCGMDGNRQWSCEAEVGLHLLHSNGIFTHCVKQRMLFKDDDCLWLHHSSRIPWNYLIDPEMYNINDNITVEFRVFIINTERRPPSVHPGKFAAPNSRSNVVLVFGENKLYASKEYLAIHSPVFDSLFFGDFAERRLEEVEMTDVLYEEFVDLLHLIYPGRVKMTDSTVLHLLKLGERFKMELVIDLAETHLRDSETFSTAEKLRLADQFRLDSLRDYCLQTYATVHKIGDLESTHEYATFSADMKAAICDRMMKLVKQ